MYSIYPFFLALTFYTALVAAACNPGRFDFNMEISGRIIWKVSTFFWGLSFPKRRINLLTRTPVFSQSEFLVRGIDKPQLSMSVIVPATRENAWSALKEALEQTYQAILRCAEASGGFTDNGPLETALRLQYFVAESQALVYSDLYYYGSTRSDVDLASPETQLFDPNTKLYDFDILEGTAITNLFFSSPLF